MTLGMPARGIVALAAVTALYLSLNVTNPTTAARSYLLVVLFVAASSRLWVAVTTSVSAALCLDYFFLPPVGTLNIGNRQDWIAFLSFVVVSLVASRLSSMARDREQELGRLFAFSRDALLGADGSDADLIGSLAHHVAQRFRLDYVAICLPAEAGFDRHEVGTLDVRDVLDAGDIQQVADRAGRPSGADGRERQAAEDEQGAGDEVLLIARHGKSVWLVPLQRGPHAVGVLAIAGRRIEPGTLKALASAVALAIERVHLLEQRERAVILQRSVELKSALLASLAHDLHTPLTAIRTAVSNLSGSSLTDAQRSGQVEIALTGVERLTRLFQNMLEMARIATGGVAPSLQWVHPSEIMYAARSQVEQALRAHIVRVIDRTNGQAVHVDPQLLSAAVAHLLENAAQYSPGVFDDCRDHRRHVRRLAGVCHRRGRWHRGRGLASSLRTLLSRLGSAPAHGRYRGWALPSFAVW